ncbi:hypothetical protein M9Y10_019023 [Tritrichomonas musculus]|uniref:Protein kinase domain-containing protein n=1 Tax=Tritrichomonas musculus TaxID=1915356 RepID=A0ABR2HID1_9EUKA
MNTEPNCQKIIINIDYINDKDIVNIYSQFKTKLFFPKFYNQNEKDLLFYLNNAKFITYNISKQLKRKDITLTNHEYNLQNSKSSDEIIVVIICTEESILIVEEKDDKRIPELLNKTISFVINDDDAIEEKTSNKKFSTEIKEFCSFFESKDDFKNNNFIKYSIHTIGLYIIGRFFYPTICFKDPTFFSYKSATLTSDQKFTIEFNNLLKPKNVEEMMEYNSDPLLANDYEEETSLIDFSKDEFIILKTLHISYDSIHYLVIHLESLHVFSLKKFKNSREIDMKYQNREIDFCKKHNNRFFVKCHGFLKEKGDIKGIVYEFMANGNLFDYINDKDNISEAFKLMTMNRIVQGLDFLHENKLIHRDLKPSNILLDHDMIPFISDYETIRIVEKYDNEKERTNDIGTELYISPEQNEGKQVSYPTDIYPFGKIIYFLYEQKELISNQNEMLDDKFDKCSEKEKLLVLLCIKSDPNERIAINSVKNYIFELNSTLNSEGCFFSNEKHNRDDICNSFEIKTTQISQYLFESINILKDKKDKLNYFFKKFVIILNQLIIIDPTNSDIINNLGNLYYVGLGVNKNYIKAHKYYNEAVNLNNTKAITNLGVQYKFGNGVKKNYEKAKELFELSAKSNDSYAFYSLGYLYFNGYGVKQDFDIAEEYLIKSANLDNIKGLNHLGFLYEAVRSKQNYAKAKECYEKSYSLNSINAIINLAFLYYEGHSVEKDYPRARQLFQLAIERGSANGYYNFGKMYKRGHGFNKDYLKAKEYFEKAGKLGQMDALHHLANLYLHGKGVEQDYYRARELYEISSKDLIPGSLYKLGCIYEYGYGVQIDYLKAKDYYELAGENGYYSAYLKLAHFFIDGIVFDADIPKAINYLLKCMKTGREEFFLENNGYYNIRYNKSYYIAANELGLIYLTRLNPPDIQKGEEYLKISAYTTYFYGRNNFGLFCELFIKCTNEISNYYPKYWYERASELKFSLAEYNLGHLLQDESEKIDHYKKASEYENNKFIFHGKERIDEQLQESISFVVLLVNCILAQYFILKSNFDKAKKYFVKMYIRIQNEKHCPFLQEFFEILPIKQYFIKLSNMNNQNKNQQIELIDDILMNKNDHSYAQQIKYFHSLSEQEKIMVLNHDSSDDFEEDNCEDPNDLFDIIKENESLITELLSCIHETIQKMENILYKPPYLILFGRIPIMSQRKQDKPSHDTSININHNFFEGLESNLEREEMNNRDYSLVIDGEE